MALSLVPSPSRAPPERGFWNLSQDFLALLSQHVRKMGKPIRTQDSKQSCDFNAYWNTGSNSNCIRSHCIGIALTPKAHHNRGIEGTLFEGRNRRLRNHSRRGFRKFNPFSALSWCYCTVARPETGKRSAS